MRPETFERELFTRLGRGYRLRWSQVKSVWCIEQQVGRGIWQLPEDTEYNDIAIRAKDGYALVCEICPQPWTNCYECGARLAIPHLTVSEILCKRCELQTGQATRVVAGYYPLSVKLLERLERTSLKREGKWQAEMHAKNAALTAAKDRDHDTYLEALLMDNFNAVANIPSFGYSGNPYVVT